MEEGEAIRRAQQGDREAFRALVECYAVLAGRTARVLTQNPEDAEDAAQDAWVDAWRAMPRFQVGRPFRPWLITLLANRCYKRLKADRMQTTPYTFELAEIIGSTPQWTGPGTDYDVELQEALAKLDDVQRRLLALRFYADLKLDEIAEVMGLPLGTIKSRLNRIMTLLRQEMRAGELAHKRED